MMRGEQMFLICTVQLHECFGHWILKFEIYLLFGAWDL
jgi:hypothetical protein